MQAKRAAARGETVSVEASAKVDKEAVVEEVKEVKSTKRVVKISSKKKA